MTDRTYSFEGLSKHEVATLVAGYNLSAANFSGCDLDRILSTMATYEICRTVLGEEGCTQLMRKVAEFAQETLLASQEAQTIDLMQELVKFLEQDASPPPAKVYQITFPPAQMLFVACCVSYFLLKFGGQFVEAEHQRQSCNKLAMQLGPELLNQLQEGFRPVIRDMPGVQEVNTPGHFPHDDNQG